MKKSTIVEIISAFLIFLFLYAALSKLLEFDKFRYQISQSPFIIRISRFVVWAIPVSEILISVALFVRRTRSAGLYSAFFLMLLFTGYIFIMLRYSPYLPCSCGGVLSVMSWKQHFVFNLVFTGLALSGIVIQNTNSRKDHSKNALTGMKLNT
ncbi:MAG TPA: MauE/DoxX family redox-associated membrane protein [Puia sp.]|nr:MauE/DoxX family redox-associated membrane protein [Puia sp.]